MILSHYRKFLFLKGRKVGGTSAEVVLAQLCGDADIISLITPIDERLRLAPPYGRGGQNFTSDCEAEERYLRETQTTPVASLDQVAIPAREYYAHMPLTEIEALQGPIPDDYKILAFDRCPFEKVLSFARMKQTFQDYRVGRSGDYSDDDLRDEIRKLFETDRVAELRNIDLYKDASGRLRAEVHHYSQMETVLSDLFATYSETMPPLPHLKRGFKSGPKPPAQSYFTPEQTARIEDVFREEFETYDFNRPTEPKPMSSNLADIPALLKPYYKAFPDNPKIDTDRLLAHINKKPLYVIAMQPRTGSSWLTELAMQSGQLGNPHELFGEGFVLRDTPIMNCRPPKMRGVTDVNDYIDQLFEEAQGLAGIEMTFHHLKALQDLLDKPLQVDAITWFYLRRRDILEQAISLARSIHTGVWHSFQNEDGKGDGLPPIEACIGQVEKLVNNEIQMEKLLSDCGITPSRLFYEGLQNNPLGTLQRIAWTVGGEVPQNLPGSTLTKLRDEGTQRLKADLRRDDRVKAALKERPALVPD